MHHMQECKSIVTNMHVHSTDRVKFYEQSAFCRHFAIFNYCLWEPQNYNVFSLSIFQSVATYIFV